MVRVINNPGVSVGLGLERCSVHLIFKMAPSGFYT